MELVFNLVRGLQRPRGAAWLGCVLLLAVALVAQGSAEAKGKKSRKRKGRKEAPESVVTPVTEHRDLRPRKSRLPWYEVDAKTPLEMKLTGPGTLRLHVRSVFLRKESGAEQRLRVLRDGRELAELRVPPGKKRKRIRLRKARKLRAGARKTFKLKVPEGTHTFRLVPSEALQRMIVRIGYRPETPPPEALALPLIPVKKAPEPEAKPTEDTKTAQADPSEAPPPPPAVAPPPPLVGLQRSDDVDDLIPGDAPRDPTPVVHITPRGGVILSLDGFGQLSPTAALELRYALPVLKRRLSVGVVAGWYQAGLALQGESASSAELWAVPIFLQLHWRLPFAAGPIRPFVAVAGGAFLVRSKVRAPRAKAVEDQSFVPGGEGALGAELELPFGALMLQARISGGLYQPDVAEGAPGLRQVLLGGVALDGGYRLGF